MASHLNNGTLAYWDTSLDPKYKEFTTSCSRVKRKADLSRVALETRRKTIKTRRR